MKLIKKWEKKTIYRTSRGTVVGKREGDFVVVEVNDNLLAKYLKIVHKFKEQVLPKFVKSEKITEKKAVKKESVKKKSDVKEVKRVIKQKKKSTSKKDL